MNINLLYAIKGLMIIWTLIGYILLLYNIDLLLNEIKRPYKLILSWFVLGPTAWITAIFVMIPEIYDFLGINNHINNHINDLKLWLKK